MHWLVIALNERWGRRLTGKKAPLSPVDVFPFVEDVQKSLQAGDFDRVEAI